MIDNAFIANEESLPIERGSGPVNHRLIPPLAEPWSAQTRETVATMTDSFEYCVVGKCLIMTLLLMIPALPSDVMIRRSWIPNSAQINGIMNEDASRLENAAAFERLAGYFTENLGQLNNEQVTFYAQSSDIQIGIKENGLLLNVFKSMTQDVHRSTGLELAGSAFSSEASSGPESIFRITFLDTNAVKPKGRGELAFRSNFFLGNVSSRWLVNVRNYMDVVYENLYDGIDLVCMVKDGHIKYEFHVKPFASPAQIGIAYEDIENLELDPAGNLVATSGISRIIDLAPLSFQGEDVADCTYSIRGPSSFGFACRGLDASRELVIDPLVFSTYIGGTGSETPYDIAVDASGTVFIVGHTISLDFPVVPGAFDESLNGTCDGFIAKMNPDGATLSWATYLGGSDIDWAINVATSRTEGIFVSGFTRSSDFPATAGAFSESFSGVQDVFVARLTDDGLLSWATYIGGNASDQIGAMSLDSSGNLVLGIATESADFPVTADVFDDSYDGLGDSVIAKLDPSGGVLLWATFLGGHASDQINSIELGSDDCVYAVGNTMSVDFPVTPGAFDAMYNGGSVNGDAFALKINSLGNELVWATFIGGAGEDSAGYVLLDYSGDVYITGRTESADFPVTPGAYDSSLEGPDDIFIAVLDSSGSALIWSTFLGGSDEENTKSAALDVAGNLWIAGWTYSWDFPVSPGALDTTFNGTVDGFFARFNHNGSTYDEATFFGGSGGDSIYDIQLDSFGYVYVAGVTNSDDFPVTPGAYDMTCNGGNDVFVAKFGPVSPPNTPPLLAWTGESGYISDGLEPESGTNHTIFTYRVAYYDADNNPPARIYVEIEKPLGTPYATLPVTFDAWKGVVGDYTSGALYSFSTMLSTGTDYWYHFGATDGWGQATGLPTIAIDAPDVVVDNLPNAVAKAFPTSSYIGEIITFNGTASTDDFGIAAYHWDFGDGSSATDPISVHAYGSRGIFTAVLTVWDNAGQNDTDSVSVSIENRMPVANAGPNQTVPKKKQAVLDGTASSDSDGDILTYTWTQIGGAAVTLSGAGTPSPYFTPSASGTYVFELSVDDGYGGTAKDTVEVKATNSPPIVEAGTDCWARKNTLVTLNGLSSSDPDGDTLAFSWDQISGIGVILAEADSATPKFTAAKVGSYVFRLTVDDGDGGISEDEVTVAIWGLPPIANLVARPLRSQVGAQIEFDASGSSDSDGVIVIFSYEFGDDQSESSSESVLNHSYAIPGFYIVTLTVWDDDGNSSATSLTVEIVPRTPPVEVTVNYKPIVAVMFAIILLVAGVWSSRRRPWKGGKGRMTMAKAFVITSMPFVLLEAATGLISLLTGSLAVPPLVGIGTGVDLCILIVGLMVALLKPRVNTSVLE